MRTIADGQVTLSVAYASKQNFLRGNGLDTQALPVYGSDLVYASSQWSSHEIVMPSSYN
ncbi:hypothetical protein AALP_AA8G204600 [Arabis alpina]|uniref:Uncharacterized protein n=1 Tax=Arabis alpina TaxID=50452 RepID=A0A087G8B2_ARAAL|nr:hypothetical protein AALP_AA8G204600 [Arabis alpina]